MRIIYGIVSIILIIVGFVFINITVDNDSSKTLMYKAFGIVSVVGGIYLFKDVAKLGRQKTR